MEIVRRKVQVRGKLQYGDTVELDLYNSHFGLISGEFEFIQKFKVCVNKYFHEYERRMHFYNRTRGRDVYLTNDQFQRALNQQQEIGNDFVH